MAVEPTQHPESEADDLVAYVTQNPKPADEPEQVPADFSYAQPAAGAVVADLERRLVLAAKDLDAARAQFRDQLAAANKRADGEVREIASLFERKLAEANARSKAYFDLLIALEESRNAGRD